MRLQFPAKLVLRLLLPSCLLFGLAFAPDNSSLGFRLASETLAWSPSYYAHPSTWNQDFCHISETPPPRSHSATATAARDAGDEAGRERQREGERRKRGERERGVEGEEREEERGLRLDGDVLDHYIVRFVSYKAASHHKHALSESLSGAKGWHWIERRNPASAFPTDFALLHIEESPREQILNALKGLSFVKDIFPQSRYTRSPLSKQEENEETEGGELNHTFLNQGKLHTRFSWDEDRARQPFPRNFTLLNNGRKLLNQHSQITSMFGADTLWKKGYTGAKVRMAVFDTGVRSDHPHFKNIKERTNWTNEDTLNDNLGHGTFVAGVIAGTDSQCLGFAPDAEIYAFRVFTDAQVSYTSWFLDAFNYAIATKMNVLNLSIGGPDYLDQPFVEKVWELTANNIIMISAIGNDGPLYGTLNNPADQSDVIGVGGIDYNDHIASFSSRGMSTWEIPHGYGRVKPDIVAYGRDIFGSKISTGCKSLSGTSVASPVVAGAVCLLASVIPENIRWDVLNPASMKQALVQGAARLNGPNMFEQGAGRLDLLESYEVLSNYKPRASVIPPYLDFTDCPYFWPFCRQPLYAGAMPIIFNATILNGMGVVGYIEGSPMWHPLNKEGNLLDIRFTFSDVIWPWTGFLGLYMQIKDEGSEFLGVLEGNITFTVVSPPGKGEVLDRRSSCRVAVKISVIPTPPRDRRILWDQFHSVRYPPGYIPRDSLDVRTDILDWHGDHLHTNFHSMFDMLRDAEYFVETLGSPLTCFEALQYGTLLMVDLEDEFFPEEIKKLEDDVKNKGLGLIVFADWYNVETMVKMKFFDDNTRSWWTPLTGGANVPALNDLLQPFGIAFGDTILNGPYSINGERGFYASGTDITRLPAGGFLHRFKFQDTIGGSSGSSLLQTSSHAQVEAAVLGAIKAGDGRVAVFGDSNCLDSSHMVINCYWLLRKLLEFTSQNKMDSNIFSPDQKISSAFNLQNGHFPIRREDVNFSLYSSVKEHAMECMHDARFDAQKFVSRTTLKRQPMAIPSNLSIPVPVVPMNDSLQNFQSTSTNDLKKVSSGKQVLTDTTTQSAVRSAKKGWQQGRIDMGFHGIGWSTHDEVDFPLTAVQGVVPLMLCVIGFVMILGLCRMQQKRPRRVRKGQMRSSSL